MTIKINKSENIKIILEQSFNQISFILFFSNDNYNFKKNIFTYSCLESKNYFFIEDFKFFTLIITEINNQKIQNLYINNSIDNIEKNNVQDNVVEDIDKTQLPQIFDNINSLGILGMFKDVTKNTSNNIIQNQIGNNNKNDGINIVIKKK